MLNDNFIHLNDVFSDEDNCSECLYGEYTILDIPTLCWTHYIELAETTTEEELERDEAYFHLV